MSKTTDINGTDFEPFPLESIQMHPGYRHPPFPLPQTNLQLLSTQGEKTFPSIKSPSGRPLQIADKGKPVTTIFA